MPPPPTDSLPDDPYERTLTQMQKRLQRVRSLRQMFAALRWGLDELDRTLADTPAGVRKKVACRSGCDFCCYVPVDVQAHEVFFAAEHIQLHSSPEALEGIVARLAAHRVRVAAYRAGERDHSRNPCALLAAGACSIYDARPQPCRAHHASDAAVCRAHRDDPTIDIGAVYIPALRARMFAVMLSVDAALETAGYDDRAYDFGSALHEALTNSLSLDTWMRHQPAFPDSCLADASDA
ncbi:MAG: YkgJ family cysteine cluster protein [Opitutae bacterium]|nr:YkgJ family cysteine cluster protein [Opitutae bacterium]